MRAARALVERAAFGTSEHTYGVNTGFGRFVSKSIPEEQTAELQLRLLRSHACGVGAPYPDEVVRAAMLLRANALAKGNSGARVETVELLLECLNRGLVSYVPARGSVGASGDLAPLAHLALPLVGEGEAMDRRASGCPAPRRSRRSVSRRSCSRRRRGSRSSTAPSSWPRWARSALVRARAARRRPPTSRARSRSRRCRARGRASCPQIQRAPAAPRPGRERRERDDACSRTRRSSSRTAGATRCRTRTRCAARRRCTAPHATCSTTSTTRSRWS